MSGPVFDLTVDYEEEEKGTVHDIQIQLQPKRARRPAKTETVKRRKRVTSKRWTGRYQKRSGGFASKSYAKRYPHLVRRVYETVTRYKLVEETRRVAGGEWTDDDAFKAFWAAHKIAKRGETLRDWTVEAIDWRKGNRSYTYGPDDVAEVLANMGGIIGDPNATITVKLARPRVGEIDV